MEEEVYQSVLAARYCRSSPLLKLLSEQHRATTLRQLWIWLAEGELRLGVGRITQELIEQMKATKDQVDWGKIHVAEKRLKHDVMAHIEAYGEACPSAKGIIHLGATSCYVQDNADLIIQREALSHIIGRVAICLKRLGDFAAKYANYATPGRTHYQEASLTTVGKRACLWAQELLMVLNSMCYFKENMKFRGVKGATGSQDSFLTLLADEQKVEELDSYVTSCAGFGTNRFFITGQTYSRQQDVDLLFTLSKLGAAAQKICGDIRQLQAFGELSEPFEAEQVGSSAMPYKRNPMKSERVCGLGRHLTMGVQEALNTLASQGLERTLDDSSNRRVVIPEAFLTAEAILITLQNIFEGMNVPSDGSQLRSLPLLALEKALILLTNSGVGREKAHAKIRETALLAIQKQERGEKVDIGNLLADSFYDSCRDEVIKLSADPLNFTGRCVSQVERFLNQELKPVLVKIFGENGSEQENSGMMHLDV